MKKTRKILLAIQQHLNLKNFRELAGFLGIEPRTVYSWANHDKISKDGLKLAKEKIKYLDQNWLETGTGPMMIIDKDNIDLLPASKYQPEPGTFISPKLVARIEPGSDSKRQELLKKRVPVDKDKGGRDEQRETDDLQISEMLVMTTRVLESPTVYRSALASNVRAFYQAVLQEEEMQSVNEKLEVISMENRRLTGQVGAMASQMDELKSMLESLGAHAPQKREANGG